MEYVIGKYEQLFSIKLFHPWFKDNACLYLSIEPDIPTKKALRQMHLIAKSYTAELKIITEMIETRENNKITQQPVYSFNKNQHMIFLLKLTDPKFFEITKLDFSSSSREIFYFSNNSKGTQLSIEKCIVTDKFLNINFEKGKVPAKETIVTSDKTEIFKTNINKNATAFQYDLSASDIGLYTAVSEFAKTDKAQTQTFYYSPFARSEPIFGIVDINASGISAVNDEKNSFIVPFEKK
jgi:hypothetical protein